jgi:hypothetical protein
VAPPGAGWYIISEMTQAVRLLEGPMEVLSIG